MSEKIILVTDPDDTAISGLRILLVDLTQNQEENVSEKLKNLDTNENIIVYIWKNLESINWLLDKLLKSDLVLFNAETDNQIICGFLASKPNSYYFGMLRDLDIYNVNSLDNGYDLKDILYKHKGSYERIFK